jgi:phage baseplate assembly protein W
VTTPFSTISGMDRHTGTALTGPDHVRQSIMDILTTPLGSRLMNRGYGSRLTDLIDAPMNAAGRQAVYAAIALAIAVHYPQFQLTGIALEQPEPGTLSITLTGHEAGAAPPAPQTVELPVLTANRTTRNVNP